MKPFRVKIITPEKTFFDGETQQLIARTTEGDIGILCGHTPYVANLGSGPLKIKMESGEFKAAAVSGGVLKTNPEQTVILANAVEWAEEIDVERAKRSEADARQRMQNHKSQREFELAENKLKRALNRLSVAQK